MRRLILTGARGHVAPLGVSGWCWRLSCSWDWIGLTSQGETERGTRTTTTKLAAQVCSIIQKTSPCCQLPVMIQLKAQPTSQMSWLQCYLGTSDVVSINALCNNSVNVPKENLRLPAAGNMAH